MNNFPRVLRNIPRPHRVEIEDSLFSPGPSLRRGQQLWICHLCMGVLKEDTGIICCTGCKTLFCGPCMPQTTVRCRSCGRKRVQFIKTILTTGGDSDDEEESLEMEQDVQRLQKEIESIQKQMDSDAINFRDRRVILESKLTAFGKGGEMAAAKVSNVKNRIAQINQKIKISNYVSAMDNGVVVPWKVSPNEGGILMDVSLCAEKYFKQQCLNLEKESNDRKAELKNVERRQKNCHSFLDELREDVIREEEMEKLESLISRLPKRKAEDDEFDMDEGINAAHDSNNSFLGVENKKPRLSEEALIVNFDHLIEQTK
ncbi:unnamed protein product [Bursaphelenchus xylophilus]|uniref:(pine wood nematode) hypothetical protein n=1 Tax=Bursaphelenchus xylophilus TaxID=6326 RepID=A0A1I7RS49_BURXY|nr:unnamed protein product [Bursaphelenchus xylophilus]CAG9123217.1 unnamed protein product [Bursaphelenchus xylophilus]